MPTFFRSLSFAAATDEQIPPQPREPDHRWAPLELKPNGTCLICIAITGVRKCPEPNVSNPIRVPTRRTQPPHLELKPAPVSFPAPSPAFRSPKTTTWTSQPHHHHSRGCRPVPLPSLERCGPDYQHRRSPMTTTRTTTTTPPATMIDNEGDNRQDNKY